MSNFKYTSRILDLQHDLPPTTRRLVQQAEAWSKQELEPLIPHHWEHASFPPHILTSFSRHCPDLLGYTLPKEYGGKGYDLLTSCLISMTLAQCDASFTTGLLVQYGLCAESILICGTPAQKQRWLPPLARLDTLGCFCLTEPQSGSDASDLQTTATPDGQGGYHLNGSKRWIGNAGMSEIFVVWARNLGMAGNPIMGFLVCRSDQRSTDAIQTTKIQGKISLRMVQNANVEFRNAYCPAANVMYQHVGFGKSVGRVLEASRVSVAWIPVGICFGALEQTISYVTERQAFGAPLSSYQLVQEKLVRATAAVSSMYLLVQKVTRDFMIGKCSLPAISMAKGYNTKLGREIIAICREVLGGNGIVLDYGIASKFCDMESTFTYEGTYDVCMLVAGRTLTGASAIKSAAGVKKQQLQLNVAAATKSKKDQNNHQQRSIQSRL